MRTRARSPWDAPPKQLGVDTSTLHRNDSSMLKSFCTFVSRHRRFLLFGGLVSAALAVLVAAGLFWPNSLDLPASFNPSNWDGRWVVVAVLTLIAVVLFLIREFTQVKDLLVGILVWGGAALSYFAVGALVLDDKAGPAMGLADNQAQARGLGLVAVIFFLIAAVLVLKSEQRLGHHRRHSDPGKWRQ